MCSSTHTHQHTILVRIAIVALRNCEGYENQPSTIIDYP